MWAWYDIFKIRIREERGERTKEGERTKATTRGRGLADLQPGGGRRSPKGEGNGDGWCFGGDGGGDDGDFCGGSGEEEGGGSEDGGCGVMV